MPLNILYKEDVARDIARIWHCCDETAVSTIAENMSIRMLKKNDLIYRERQAPTTLIYLVRGKVKIVKECGMGRTQIVRAIKEHCFLGYRAFFAKECYTTSAMAFETSIVATIPLDTLLAMMSGYRGIVQYFMYELAATLGQTDARIVSLTQKHIRGRLAETILSLKDSYGIAAGLGTLDISMNRDDLASMSNMSTSNAIRTLSAFAREGIVATDGKKIKILDEAKLKRISEME